MDAWIKTGSCRKRQTSANYDEPSTSGTSASCNTPKGDSVSEVSELNSFLKKAKPCFRKYNADYLKYGFVFCGTEDEPLPQCVVCFEVLANESMKPSKLERHLSRKHAEYVSKPIDFFQNKKREFFKSKSVMTKSTSGEQNKQTTIASYRLSLLIAKKGAAHTVGEDIILPAAKIISDALFSEKQTKLIGEIPLSNTTVKRRIDEMSDFVKQSMITVLKQSEYFSLQLDESTDVAGEAILLAFVRFEFDGRIEEEMLFCKCLPSTTMGEEIFKCLDGFILDNEIEWSKCVALTTDGARAMSGIYSGLIAKVRAVAPSVQWTHCSLHREALVLKGLAESLKKILNDAVKIVNFIKSRPKNSRLFAVLCDEMGSEHKTLLLHCEIRWLSRGKVLSRLFELRDELRMFLLEHKSDAKSVSSFLEMLNDENWLIRLSYLGDIFSALNILNLSLQGKDVHKFYVQDKIEATIKKLERWSSKVKDSCFDAFPLLNDFLETYGIKVNEETATAMKEHLEALASSFR